jgi:hypothetical protein
VPVPITFPCSCGKTLRVKDDLVGRWVRCPACKETANVPEAGEAPKPAFEVIEDEPAPPPARKRVTAEAAPFRFDDDAPPPRPRSRPDQEYDGPRKASKRKRSRPKEEEPQGHFALERRVVNGGVLGGLAAMVGAVVWFVLGLQADRIFFYPPILFILGMFAVVKGLVGGNDD